MNDEPTRTLGFLVLADDRTGALETAGRCADGGMRTVVTPVGRIRHRLDLMPNQVLDDWVSPATTDCLVVDMASRHLDAGGAASIVATFGIDAARQAHKIDSTLRGNWASEVIALGRRVLVVAAFPAAGRTTIGGVVHEHGTPVHLGPAGSDGLDPVRSSRPDEHLLAAGAVDVSGLSSSTELEAWLSGPGTFAVCDASTDIDLASIAAAWFAHPDVVLAGTAASIGAAAAAIAGEGGFDPSDDRSPMIARHGSRVATADHDVDHQVLVACGSLHPNARAQLDHLRAHDLGDRIVIRATPALDVGDSATTKAAAALAAEVDRAIVEHPAIDTLVVVGGDTAAAILGDASVAVEGSVAVGVPRFRLHHPSGRTLTVLTKPGGFGGPSAVADLIAAILDR